MTRAYFYLSLSFSIPSSVVRLVFPVSAEVGQPWATAFLQQHKKARRRLGDEQHILEGFIGVHGKMSFSVLTRRLIIHQQTLRLRLV